MSTSFGEAVEREQRSSVKITMNAKGEAQVEVKGYSHDLEALEETRVQVTATYLATVKEVRGG